MSFSSGTRSLVGEAASWIFLAGMCAVGLTYFEDLKALTADALGLEKPGAVAAASDSSEPAHSASQGGSVVELRAVENGHFQATAEVNGRDIEVMVDTGASLVALTWEDAERAGVFVTDKDFTHRVSTANGTARVAPVRLSKVSIGDITVRDVQGVVSERGALGVTLLGMSFLGRLDRVDMRSGGVLVLED